MTYLSPAATPRIRASAAAHLGTSAHRAASGICSRALAGVTARAQSVSATEDVESPVTLPRMKYSTAPVTPSAVIVMRSTGAVVTVAASAEAIGMLAAPNAAKRRCVATGGAAPTVTRSVGCGVVSYGAAEAQAERMRQTGKNRMGADDAIAGTRCPLGEPR